VSLIPEFLPFNDTTICTGSRLEINLLLNVRLPKTTEFIDSLYYDYDDFEGGSGSSDDWSERNGVDPQVVSNTSYKGNHSLYFNNGWGRNFEFQTEFGQPYGGYFSADYPFMSMAYKIPSGSFTTMLVHIAGIGWRGIAFTQGEQLGCYGPKVGSWNVNDTLVRNNQWHFKTINLHDQLQQSLGSGNYKIESIIFHDACTNTGTQGEMWIDEFMITRYKPNYYTSVSWSNGDTTSTITVSPTQTTTYYVTASNGIHSCTDSVTVNVLPNPLNPNLFASDTLFHCGDSLVINAGAGFDRYEWSTSDTTHTNTVRGTGWYRCRVFDGLCSVEDSVFVSLNSYRIAQDDTAICIGTAIVLGTVSSVVGSTTNLIIPEGSVYQADSVRTILSNQAVTGSRTIEVVQSTDFRIGDLLCITTSQVNSISDSNLAGAYEIRRILGINGQILTIEAPLEHSYPLPQNAVTQVIRVPEFNEVWVEGTLTCKEWDGTTGGILLVRANKITVSNNGRITADAKGFRGGQEVSGWGGGYQGEGPYGVGGRNYEPNGTGGGGGNAEWCHSGQGGGGGGYSNVGGNGIVHCYSCGGGWWFPSGCGASGFGGQVLSNHMGRMLMGSGGGSGGIDGDNPDGGGWGGRGGGVV
jgi:hypothetical protein